MAKKNKAVYAPGELDKIRGKLGDLDANEAKRMVQVLGGEIGYERTDEQEAERKKPVSRRETVELKVDGRHASKRQSRRIDMIGLEADSHSDTILHTVSKPIHKNPADDPTVTLRTSYSERVKIDRYASLPEFDIKTPMQALISALSFFLEPVDYVSPILVNRRMNDYYKSVTELVNSTRTLFPRNNAKRSERMKKLSPFSFSILDTIRFWNIERITADLAKIQSHPRSVRVQELADILRAIYKPLFILEKLDIENHIKGAYKLLYKVLFTENPAETKEKFQALIKTALSSFVKVSKDVHYYLYPLVLKHISDRWFPYETLFVERRNRFLAFIKASANEQIYPPQDNVQQTNNTAGESSASMENNSETSDVVIDLEPEEEPDPNDPVVRERKAREDAQKAEQKILEKGLETMELLFPKAGWDRISTYPDLYPYFADIFKMGKGYGLIAPDDPMQQIAVLMHILGDFFFGIRYVTFGSIIGADGNLLRVDDFLGSIANNWQRYTVDSFDKEYLPRLSEFCQMLEQSSESRTSIFGKRTINELNWAKRLYYLPYYKFETIGPPPFKKGEITPIYNEIKLLRKYLTVVASGIEQGNKQGGAEAMAPCDGIDNPWEPYNFEIPNPVSTRLDALLSPKKRTNAALIYFCLSAAVILDYLVNNENSWAYSNRSRPLFRSLEGEGIIPLFGVESKLDADMIFKQAVKQRQIEREQQKKQESNT